MSIKKELMEATGVTKAEDDSPQSFLLTLARKASNLSEDAWDTLSDVAKEWVNTAGDEVAAAKKDNRDPILPLPKTFEAEYAQKSGAPEAKAEPEVESEEEAEGAAEVEVTEEPAAEEESASEPVATEEKPVKKSNKTAKATKEPKAAKVAKAKAEKPAAEPKAEKIKKSPKDKNLVGSGSARMNTVGVVTIKNVIEHPDWDFERISAKVLTTMPKAAVSSMRNYYLGAKMVERVIDAAGLKLVKK